VKQKVLKAQTNMVRAGSEYR